MKTHGFSLLEVLVAWSILSIAALGLAEILTIELRQTQKIYQNTLIKLQVREAFV